MNMPYWIPKAAASSAAGLPMTSAKASPPMNPEVRRNLEGELAEALKGKAGTEQKEKPLPNPGATSSLASLKDFCQQAAADRNVKVPKAKAKAKSKAKAKAKGKSAAKKKAEPAPKTISEQEEEEEPNEEDTQDYQAHDDDDLDSDEDPEYADAPQKKPAAAKDGQDGKLALVLFKAKSTLDLGSARICVPTYTTKLCLQP